MRYFLIFTLFSLLLCGCNEIKSDMNAPEPILNLPKEIIAESFIDNFVEKEEKEPKTVYKLPKSIEDKMIAYEGLIPFNYVCAYYDSIYLSSRDQGEGSFLLMMKNGENIAEKLPVQAPADMEFAHIATDTSGNLYAVVINIGNSDNCYIWKFDSEYSVIEKFDISDYMTGSDWYPWAFSIAGNGDLYLRIGAFDGIIALVFDSNGKYVSKIEEEGKYKLLDAMGRGTDGNIYAVLHDEDFNQYLVILDGRNGCVWEIIEDNLPTGAGIYACVGAGEGSDLLIYGPGTGIIIYDVLKRETKNHIPASAIPYETDGKRSIFLPDNRLLLIKLGTRADGSRYYNVAEEVEFYYIAIKE
jgi:hypothetical protein